MPGSKFVKLNACGSGTLGQSFKFYHGIAPNAGIGCSAGQILLFEIGQNQFLVLFRTVNDMVRDIQLPAEFVFSDFHGQEKITDFPKPVDLSNAPRGMVGTKGKLFIYVPWGNMGIFYKDFSHRPDNNLIELGNVESGLENLSSQKSDFTAQIEIIN